jgi:hypothetical protein
MVGKTLQKFVGIVKVRDTHPNILVKPEVTFFRDLSGRTWHPEQGHFAINQAHPPVTVDPEISTFHDREGRQFNEKSNWDFYKGLAVGGGVGSVVGGAVGLIGGIMFDRLHPGSSGNGDSSDYHATVLNHGDLPHAV